MYHKGRKPFLYNQLNGVTYSFWVTVTYAILKLESASTCHEIPFVINAKQTKYVILIFSLK